LLKPDAALLVRKCAVDCALTTPRRSLNDGRMFHRLLTSLGFVALLSSPLVAADGVKITEQADKLRIEINGEHFTDYCFQGAPHVYFYPLIGPGGASMTRNWPMKEVEGEEKDHPHHRSLWYSHGLVNGVDFWSETPKAGKIVHDKFLEVKSGKDSGVIRSANKWIAPDGSVTMTDERTFRVFTRANHERLFDFEVTLKAGDRDVVLGDTKEGSMAIRVNESMRGVLAKQKGEKKAKVGKGRIALSSGVTSSGSGDEKAWGKRAAWCDYSGPVDGKTVGVAIFDHPSNPKHPTWWHVREYGLFAANPFGVHDFEKQPKGAGDITIPAGKSVTFKYRFYLHAGDEIAGKVADRYQDYVAGK
jgi:Methane oxygenase PmoA